MPKINLKLKSLFFLFAFLLLGQGGIAQKGEFPQFEIGIEGGVTYAYRSLKIADPSQFSQISYDHLNKEQTGSYLPQGSLLFSWNPYSRWRLSTGISYAIRGYESEKIKTVVLDPNGPNIPESFSYKSRLKCLEVPLLVDAFLWKRPKKFNLFLRAGLMYAPKVEEEFTIESHFADRTESHSSVDDLVRKNLLFFEIAPGIHYRIGNRFQAELLLKYQRAITPLVKRDSKNSNAQNPIIDTYLWNVGPIISCRYSL